MPRSLKKGPVVDGHLRRKVDAARATGLRAVQAVGIEQAEQVLAAHGLLDRGEMRQAAQKGSRSR